MLCRLNPRAVRIRPSQGDGGIDVIQVTPDGWIVDQIKYFAENLDAKQKKQIAKSFKKVRAFAAQQGASIAEWHLVTPLDPTKENRLDWFRSITADADFACEWRGKAHVDGWAAKFPEVIDYYLRDGRNRLERLVTTVATLCNLFDPSDTVIQEGVLEPADTVAGLRSVYEALNAHDPHYRYSFSVDGELVDVPPEPHQVAVLQIETASCWVTFKVYARYDAAVLDRPVPIFFEVTAAPDSEAARIMADFQTYGAPVVLSAGDGASITVTADLPAGLGQLLSGQIAGFSITALPATPFPVRLQLIDSQGRELAIVRLNLQPALTGMDGFGQFIAGTEQHGVFDIEFRIHHEANTVTTMLKGHDPTGLAPDDVLPALRLLSGLHHPNQYRVLGAHGPKQGDAIAVPHPESPSADLLVLTKLVEALSIMQQHTHQQIHIPNTADLDLSAILELIELGQLLKEGRLQSRWTTMSTTLTPGTRLPEDGGALLVVQQVAYTLEGRLIDLGRVQRIFASVRLTHSETESDGRRHVTMVPGHSDTLTTIHEP
jgi:hypothetical protein